MKKLIRIDFALKNPQTVIIYGYDEELNKKEIGCIFSPAGSGEYIVNGIQVCGFSEAYDYWGCARYKFPITDKEKIVKALEGNKNFLVQAKDIQLLFDIETVQASGFDIDVNECVRCYNSPCTCDNKIDEQKDYDTDQLLKDYGKGIKHLSKNPYNIKREGECKILKKTEDLDCDYEYLDDVLIKKPKLKEVKFNGEDKNKI